MQSLFAEARASAVVLSSVRMEARDSAVKAIRSLEARLVEALSGERLRGLPNVGTRRNAYYAARVNTPPGVGVPLDGREVLALDANGHLTVLRMQYGAVLSRPVLDAELVLEDVKPVTRLIAEKLEQFVALSERRTAGIESIERFSKALIELIEKNGLEG